MPKMISGQLSLPLDNANLDEVVESTKDNTSTFSSNMSVPIHRWFRYSAGFSASWARELIETERNRGRCRVMDPFAGSGTVVLESCFCDVEAIGIEAHPFVARVARAKLLWREDVTLLQETAKVILQQALNEENRDYDYPSLILKCFPPDTLIRLDALRRSWLRQSDGSPVFELIWLALASILRECSPVGTAQWQYVLPNKTKMKIADPYTAFEAKIASMARDMLLQQQLGARGIATFYQEDARKCTSIPDQWSDLVITSPPYANNYDYADATRLEMSFFGEIEGWGDLQQSIRQYLIRSCTQHISGINDVQYQAILDDPLLLAIQTELLEVCSQLKAERENHGGKKPYHVMIASYFSDMAQVWHALRRVTQPNCLICFVIGDSAPYGIHVPVEKWLGTIAINAGFSNYTFQKTRDRNVKWKNRKHRVPLHEGRLWVKG